MATEQSLLGGYNDYCLPLHFEFQEVKLRQRSYTGECFIETVDISPDNTKLLLGGSEGYLTEYCLITDGATCWEGHKKQIWKVNYNREGTKIASCSSDCLIKIWSSEDHTLFTTLSGHMDTVWACIFLHTHGSIATCSSDHYILIWDFYRASTPSNLALQLSALSEASSGASVSKSDHARKKKRIFVKGHKPLPFSHLILNKLSGHDNVIEGLALSKSGKYLVSCSRDQTIRIWKHYLEEHKTVFRILKGHKDRVLSCRFPAHREDILASTSSDKTVLIWDIRTRAILWHLNGHTNVVWSCCFVKMRSGLILLSCSSDHSIRSWDVTTGIELWKINDIESVDDTPPQVLDCIVSPDNNMVVVTTSTGTVYKANVE